MDLPLTAIRQLQSELDDRIMLIHHLDRAQTRQKRILALMVEIGELANETRCFKFWSLKPASSREVILEELSDTLHFIISLGIDLNDTSSSLAFVSGSASLTTLMIDWTNACISLNDNFTLDNYLNCLSYIGKVSLACGFEADEVWAYYQLKNAKNHLRQDNNY
jgi:dimeric dUTPase (all-alpha-NTP-PPase superfamily)